MHDKPILSLIIPQRNLQLNLFWEGRYYRWRHSGGIAANANTTSKQKALDWAAYEYPEGRLFLNEVYIGTWEELPLLRANPPVV